MEQLELQNQELIDQEVKSMAEGDKDWQDWASESASTTKKIIDVFTGGSEPAPPAGEEDTRTLWQKIPAGVKIIGGIALGTGAVYGLIKLLK